MKKRILAAIMSACMLVTMGVPMVSAAGTDYGTMSSELSGQCLPKLYTANEVAANTGNMIKVAAEFKKGADTYPNNVLFNFSLKADNGAKVQAWAFDPAGNNWVNIADMGTWGPSINGFPIADGKTDIYLTVDKPSTVTFKGALVDAKDHSKTVIAMEDGVYDIGYADIGITAPEAGLTVKGLLNEAPADNVSAPNLPKANSTLKPGYLKYDNNVMFKVDITASNGATVQAWAKNYANRWFDVAKLGTWGETGFPIGNGSTDYYFAADKDCTITVNVTLVDAADNSIVLATMPTSTYDIGVTGYNVTFNSNGGSDVASQTVHQNNTITKPAVPTRDGYIFAGWFTDDALTTAYDFTTKVTSDTTLYAAWVKAEDSNTEVIVPEPSKDVPEIKVDNKVTEQVPLTDEEQAAIKAGAKLEVSFDVKKIEAPANADVIEAALGENQKVGMYLDITMLKKIGNNAGVAVTELNGKIRMTLTIPEELRGQVSYQIVRVHNGVATVLADLDTDPNTITFETDEFSTYALTYTATAVDNSSSNSSSGSSSTGDKTPSTGDATTSVVGLIALAALSLTATGIIVKSKKSGKTK